MDFRHIKAFIAVAETLSVTRAAERLHISQPPLTRHIHQLEEELGVTLFVRHRHGVTLTDAGRALLDKARALDALAADFHDTARRAAGAQSSTIRVGIAWGLWDVVNSVRVHFAARHPHVSIGATDANCWEDAGKRLREGQLDVLFTRPPIDAASAVAVPLYAERIQAILPDSSPLARRPSVSIRELASKPLLLWDRHIAPTLYDKILDLYARTGLSPSIVPTPGAGPFNPAGLMLVASGKGIYLGYGVPLSAPRPPSGVAVRPVSDPDATIDVCVASRKNESSPLVAHFLDSVRQVFPRHAASGSTGELVARHG